MRIVSGKYRGRAINPPKNLRARPTTDFAKENLFNVLGNLVDFEECDVLDLFAGTGSISYEFASRGVHSVTSVEINPVHYNFIKKTAADLGIDNLFAVKANVFLYLKSCAKQFDLIFSDAPYDLEGSEEVIRLVLERDLLKPDGFLVFEHSKNINFRPTLTFGNQEVTEACNFLSSKVRKSLEIQIFVLPLHSQSANGVVVQLVRIPACHAGGRGFESRPYRKISKQMIAKPCKVYLQGFFLFLYPKKVRNALQKQLIIRGRAPYFVLEAFSYCTLNLTSHRLLE